MSQSRSAVASFMAAGSFSLGGNLSVAVGPLGRNAEGSGALNTKGQMAAMYSYSKTKGLFGGVSVEGSVIAERSDANRIAYGANLTAKQLLTGQFDPPEWANVLIHELDKATGSQVSLPGGRQWIEDDSDYGPSPVTPSPSKSQRRQSKIAASPGGGGYAFGEASGGGGGTTGARKRSSSLFSIGGGSDKGSNSAQHTGAVFTGASTSMPNVPRDISREASGSSTQTPADRAAPARPWERRSSTLIPFSNSMNFGKPKNDRRAGPSSESYNADDSYSSPNRPRAGSNPRRPYELKATPSPFASASELGSRSVTPNRSIVASPVQSHVNSPIIAQGGGADLLDMGSSPTRTGFTSASAPNGHHANGHSNGTSDADLLGSWDADGKGLTASFARLNARSRSGSLGSGGTPSRSRRGSGTVLPFDDIAEDTAEHHQARKARLRESTSAFAGRDWRDFPLAEKKGASTTRASTVTGTAGGGKARPFSTYGSPQSWDDYGKAAASTNHFEYAGPSNGYKAYINGTGNGVNGIRRVSDTTRPGSMYPTDDLRSNSNNSNHHSYDFDEQRYPFDDYVPRATANGTGAAKPVLARKEGLNVRDGFARAVALFDFRPAEEGDLGFKKGQVVVVLDSAGGGGDWWRGRLATGGSGREGIFPSNYIEVLDIPRELRGGLTRGELKRRVAQLEFD